MLAGLVVKWLESLARNFQIGGSSPKSEENLARGHDENLVR